MPVQVITTFKDLQPLRDEWNELSGSMPFRSWDWLATWWKHYGNAGRRKRDADGRTSPGRQLYVLAVYNDGDEEDYRGHRPRKSQRGALVGIAPWFLDRTVVKGGVLRWLGCGEVCTDHLTLLCRPEHREQVAAETAKALATQLEEWDQLALKAVDADDFTVLALADHLEEYGCIVSRQQADSCWVLDLPASWDAYLASISKSHRKQLRQLERRVIDADRTAWLRVTNAAEFEAAWPILVDLHQRRRRSLGEPGCFASQAFHDFHYEVARRMLDRGQLRMSWLELDGSPAAAEYHFADEHATYAYQGGVDPERLDEEPGRLSTILFIQQAIVEGHKQIDFLRGDEPYKAHWRAEPRTTYNYRVVPNRRLAKLRGRVLTLTNTVADWMRGSVQQQQ